MNILYLAHRIPFPPDKGDKLRSYRQIRHLAERSRVWCACFVDTPRDRRYVTALKAFCEDVAAIRLNRASAAVRGLLGLLQGGTVTESYYRHPAMKSVLRTWARSVRFDAVVAFSSGMASFALDIPAARRTLDMCDLDSSKWLGYAAAFKPPMRPLYQVEGRRLAAAERRWIALFDATILITKSEAMPLMGAVPPDRLHIVGNGADLPVLQTQAPNARAHAPVIGFVGVMNYRPNVDAVCWFAKTCWLRIRQAYPRAIFRIVGRAPTRQVRQLGRVPGVCVVGGVADVHVEVSQFDVSVAPLRMARGLQNKVLEAMAAARPVVLTAKAAEGIAARHGIEFLVADSANDMSRSVLTLLGDPERRSSMGDAARRFVATHHRWETELTKLELIATGTTTRHSDPGRSSPAQDVTPGQRRISSPDSNDALSLAQASQPQS